VNPHPPVVAGAAQRDLFRGGDHLDAGDRLQRRQHIEHHAVTLFIGQLVRHRHVDDADTVDANSRVDAPQVRHTSEQKAGAGGQQHGECDLTDDQHGVQRAASARDAAGSRRRHRALQVAAPERNAWNHRDD
jgi:hypothetical protein